MNDTAVSRFWEKVERGGEDECWMWTGGTGRGYGRFYPDPRRSAPPRQVPAHRFAYELLVGPIPEGMTLDHLCRNRACVNPAHLEPVTGRENTMRGESPSAQNARKTHCRRGHPYDEENTFWVRTAYGRGRKCRICERDPARRRGWRVESGQ